MISSITSNPNLTQVIISTGNILNANKTVNSKTNEELLDGLKLALNCNGLEHVEQQNKDLLENGKIYCGTQELNARITENERSEINVGVKLFINKNSAESVGKAIQTSLEILQLKYFDNVVLAYHTGNSIQKNCDDVDETSTKVFGHGGTVKELQEIWAALEEFALQKQIKQLGISDVNTDTLSQLHAASRIPPTISQINLASCCVVPQDLREFCAEHDIQLLTHGDPEVLLSDEPFILPGYSIDWALRYQVHLRCRGVLSAKGYIVGATRS